MNIEDWDPPKPSAKPKDLTLVSVVDLKAYIEALRQEIARAEGEIARKEAHRTRAADIFKS